MAGQGGILLVCGETRFTRDNQAGVTCDPMLTPTGPPGPRSAGRAGRGESHAGGRQARTHHFSLLQDAVVTAEAEPDRRLPVVTGQGQPRS